ncbi:MAG: class I SAM-dependent methyltransferase [Bacteroidales bacterium]|nr:class I SAM-dependent methyltransferase [Bacteroidales bacterium]
MTQTRLQREKEYHNAAFSEGIRQSADKYYTIHKISFEQISKKMLSFCEGKKVLEFGCGPGSHSLILAKKAKEVSSIDISDFAIQKAKSEAEKRGLYNLGFFEMNAEELKFSDSYFDMIYGNAIIHHLDLEKAFIEINRVLKSGGKAFFYEPLGHNFFINFYRILTPKMRTVDEHPLLIADLKLIRKHFKNVEIEYFHFFTLLSVPFRNFKFFKNLLNFLFLMDKIFFLVLPFMKKYAWYCIIEISKE